MKFFFVVTVLFFNFSCTTLSPQTQRLLKVSADFKKNQINDIPFIAQSIGDCGPTALSMALNGAGKPVTVKKVSPLVFTPDKSGSLPTNMIGAVRSFGMLGLNIDNLQALVAEVQAGHPVVILQNLGFSWYPNWHYAVVVGYDLEAQVFYLHSGTQKNSSIPMTYFERHWQLADHWALVVIKPGQLTATGDELAHMKAASGLEIIGLFNEAELSYQTILKKWPQSLGAYVGLANVEFHKKNYKKSESFIKKALTFDPDSKVLLNNLMVIQEALRSETQKTKKR